MQSLFYFILTQTWFFEFDVTSLLMQKTASIYSLVHYLLMLLQTSVRPDSRLGNAERVGTPSVLILVAASQSGLDIFVWSDTHGKGCMSSSLYMVSAKLLEKVLALQQGRSLVAK